MKILPWLTSDIYGAFASTLCILHCMATPFIFVVQSCAAEGCCESAPGWWHFIDFFFVVITFFAVCRTVRTTSLPYITYILCGTWILLTVIIINEKVAFLQISEWWKYIAALGLITGHIFNLRHCRCSKDRCCVNI